MAILDSKGRLFGKISILDLGAGLIILMIIGGIFFLPGNSGSVAQIGSTVKPIEFDLIARGLTVGNPKEFLTNLQQQQQSFIVIRNQPYPDPLKVVKVQSLPRTVAAPQPDGSVKPLPDPRPELQYTVDLMVTLSGNAQIVDDGPVLAGSKIKVGTPTELEGQTYRFNASVVGVRILD